MTSNLPPIANPGIDRDIPGHQKVILDGSSSSDPDNGPQPLVYAWTLLSKPTHSHLEQANITGANAVKASFTADALGAYVFRLTVSDGTDAASKDLTLHAANLKPVANPGATVLSAIDKGAILDGSESYDADNDRITFVWTLVSAPAGSAVKGATPAWSPRPYVVPDRAGDYVFRLVVRDKALESDPKDVLLRAFAGNVPPTVNPGRSERPERVGEAVVIRPAVRDLDGPKAVTWTVSAGATGVSSVNAATGETTFITPSAGRYTLTFSASDGAATGTADLIVNAYAAGQELPPYGNRVLVAGPTKQAIILTAPFATTGMEPLRTLAYRPPSSALVTADPFTPDAAGVFLVQLTEASSRFERLNFVNVIGDACDADLDGAKTPADAEWIRRFIGDIPLPGADPRDANRDGKIDQADVTFCSVVIPPAEIVSPPYLSIDPALIELTWQRGTPLPAPVSIFVEGDAIEFTVSSSGRGIVQVTPTTGSLPITSRLTVTLLSSVTTLPPGRYEDIVTVSSPRSARLSQTRVVLTVTETPQLLVSQQPMVFRFRRGGANPPPQPLYVTATVRPISFTAEVAEGAWLQVNPSMTMIPANLTVQVNPFGLAAGTYSGRIRVASKDAGNSPKEVPVTLIIE